MELPSNMDPFKITRRDFFAGMILCGYIAKYGIPDFRDEMFDNSEETCRGIFKIADSMQDAREFKDE